MATLGLGHAAQLNLDCANDPDFVKAQFVGMGRTDDECILKREKINYHDLATDYKCKQVIIVK